MKSLKAAAAYCAGCFGGLVSATGALSLSSHLRGSSLYTSGSQPFFSATLNTQTFWFGGPGEGGGADFFFFYTSNIFF